MASISVFDVLGPNMIGPSSSHTAGADSLAFLAQKMINGPLRKVVFTLYGSFAKTYRGHGTDRAFWVLIPMTAGSRIPFALPASVDWNTSLFPMKLPKSVIPILWIFL